MQASDLSAMGTCCQPKVKFSVGYWFCKIYERKCTRMQLNRSVTVLNEMFVMMQYFLCLRAIMLFIASIDDQYAR